MLRSTVGVNKSEYGGIFATAISLVLVYSAESSIWKYLRIILLVAALVLLDQAVMMTLRQIQIHNET